jgi:competence protein ComEA
MDPAPLPARPPTPPDPAAWPHAAQVAAALLISLAAFLLGLHTYRSLPLAARPTELHAAEDGPYRIDLNRASPAELQSLPGVGPKLAEAIETHRRENGEFQSVDDLTQVRGVGPANLARIRPWVSAADPEEHAAGHVDTTLDPPNYPKKTAAPLPKKSAGLTGRIDVNRASREELQRLPGIGPKLAERIVEERARRPFRSVDDLDRVPGIGPKTLEKLRPFVRVGGEPERVVTGD